MENGVIQLAACSRQGTRHYALSTRHRRAMRGKGETETRRTEEKPPLLPPLQKGGNPRNQIKSPFFKGGFRGILKNLGVSIQHPGGKNIKTGIPFWLLVTDYWLLGFYDLNDLNNGLLTTDHGQCFVDLLTWSCPCAKKALPQRGWHFPYRYLRHRFCSR